LSDRCALYQRPESDLEQLQIPLSRTLRDFTPRMAEAIAYLAEWEKRPALEVLHDLLLPPADVLRFAEAGPEADGGNVPLEHGLALLAGARKTLLAAACSVIRPQPFHPRLSLAEAEQFLARCRLGQTELGSYVVAVACPLDARPDNHTLVEAAPFGRQVSLLLMKSVHRLVHAVEIGDPESALEPVETEPVVSANLCEGLLDMTPEGDGSVLTISASWARTYPPPTAVSLPREVRLRRETFFQIEALAERLRPAHAPQRRLLVGYVETLNGRPNADGQLEGQVILRLVDPESDTLRARTDLSPADYHTAWLAHGENLPITLQGIVRRAGRTFRIEEVTGFRLLQQTLIAIEGT
jgi:hypothetical protein